MPPDILLGLIYQTLPQDTKSEIARHIFAGYLHYLIYGFSDKMSHPEDITEHCQSIERDIDLWVASYVSSARMVGVE